MKTVVYIVAILGGLAVAVAFLCLLGVPAHSQGQTCRFGPDGYTCRDYRYGPVESETRIAPFKEQDPIARMRDWENDCRTTLYFDKRNYAHAARVAKRCGMQLQ